MPMRPSLSTLLLLFLFTVGSIMRTNAATPVPTYPDYLAIYQQNTGVLHIPALMLNEEIFWIDLRVDSEEQIIVVDSGPSVVNTTSAARFDSRTGKAHIPYAAIASGDQLEQERYLLELELVAEVPQIVLKATILQAHELRIRDVVDVADVAAVAQLGSGETMTVMGEKDHTGRIISSSGVVFTDAEGNQSAIYLNDDGTPESLVSADTVLLFRNYRDDSVDLEVRATGMPVQEIKDQSINPAMLAAIKRLQSSEVNSLSLMAGSDNSVQSGQHALTTHQYYAIEGGLIGASVGLCALGIVSSPTGLGLAAAAIGCTAAFYSLTNAFYRGEPAERDAVSRITDAAGCFGDGCLSLVLSEVSAKYYKDAERARENGSKIDVQPLAPDMPILNVTKTGTGQGTITSNPAGINCSDSCSAEFSNGQVIILIPEPSSNATFAGWGGACSGLHSCVVTMNQAQSVTATFNASQSSAIQSIEMVTIPAGSFQMGRASGGLDRERPVRTVNVPSFRISKYEVTFAQWDACVSDGGCAYRPSDSGWGRGDRPVMNVNYNDVTQQFIPWLNEKTGQTFRLPSEAEWEYAARAGTTTDYHWGEAYSHEYANFGDGRNGVASGRDQWIQTAPVGSFPANAYGLHDMHGNVFEWVQDCMNGSYDGAPTNGSAWMEGNCSQGVRRGGSWQNDGGGVSFRSFTGRSISRYATLGFRLAQDI
jgi:formylglycine-generating enzyme required for sulfatase activity